MRFFIFLSPLWLIFLFSCGGNRGSIPVLSYTEAGPLSCRSNSSHSYFLSRPSGEYGGALALILVLDPKGEAKNAVNLFASSADFAPFVIASSAVIKNGTSDFEARIEELIDDVGSRYENFDGRIILCGFSGGARMASAYARSHELKGALLAGAGLPFEIPNTKVFVIAGTQDFNFNEVYRRPEAFMLKNEMVLSDAHPGRHEWPPIKSLRDGLLFISQKFSGECKQAAWRRANELIGEADSLSKSGRCYLAWKGLEKSAKCGSDDIAQIASEKAEEMLKSKEYRLEITSLENHLELENKLRKHYSEGSISGDASFWQDEIRRLEVIGENTDIIQEDHLARVRAYLGILFYSRLKQIIFDPEKQELAAILVNSFSSIEPGNADMLYFKSVHEANAGRMDSASHYLALARQAGFKE